MNVILFSYFFTKLILRRLEGVYSKFKNLKMATVPVAVPGMGNSGGSGLCVFTCTTIFSGLGAFLALMDLDIGPESAFLAVEGSGGLCFAKCQYLQLIRAKLNKNGMMMEVDDGHGYQRNDGSGQPLGLRLGFKKRIGDSEGESYGTRGFSRGNDFLDTHKEQSGNGSALYDSSYPTGE